MMEVSTRAIAVKGSGYILKAEQTGYDVRYESNGAVKDDVIAFEAKHMQRQRCH